MTKRSLFRNRPSAANFLALGTAFLGRARSVSSGTVQGISLIEDGIKNLRAIGGVLCMPYFLALKAEALHLVHRTAEALGSVINATTPARVVVP